MHTQLASETLVEAGRSATGARWALRPADERASAAIAQRLGLPDVIARLLAARGVGVGDAELFLAPSLKRTLPDPSAIRDMEAAAERLAAAAIGGECVAVFGDYDVDGATSSALLLRYFRALGVRTLLHIPDRMAEGYGPNAPALLALKEKGAAVVVTVDCGTAAFEPLQAAFDAGLDVIVVDHHLGEPRCPKAFAVVNPNRFDDNCGLGHFAAVGVAFLLLVALNRALRKADWFAARPEPDLRQWLDLVALGTVCDMVPLALANRALVIQGLKVMAGRRNTGIRRLLELAALEERPGAYHAGFVLGPRINAGGRIGKADLGARLLSTDDETEALEIARELDRLNAERKTLEALAVEEAAAEAGQQGEGAVLMLASTRWHPGVIGIVAGRLRERFDRPAAVIALAEGIGKASARSVPGVDFGAAIVAARAEGLLIAGGGHAMAAGFTVAEGEIPRLRAFLEARLGEGVARHRRERALLLDGALGLGGANVEMAALVERAGPFGPGNPAPRFMLRGVRALKASVVGNGHVRALLVDAAGGQGRIFATAFHAAETPLGAALRAPGKTLHVAGQLRLDHWQGREQVKFQVEDAAETG